MPGEAAAPIRVTIVTLDNHLAGAVERARPALAADGIRLDLHAASDWDRERGSLDRAKAAIADADILIVTMLFLDDHIRAVLPALQARREDCDAFLGVMSGAEVVRLTRLGGYRMDAPARGPLALLKRLRGSGKPGSSGAGQMRMLRRLPKLLRFLPGTAQDVRAYFLTLQYWLAGSDDNVAAMARLLVGRYAAGPRAHLRGRIEAAAPRAYPEVGVYHPDLPGRMGEDAAALPRSPAPRGRIGLLLLRSYLLGRDAAHYDGVIRALEAEGLEVVPAFASGLDGRAAIDRYFLKDGRATIDALVSLTGFSLVGGPAYSDTAAAAEILGRLDVPYVSAQPIEFQTLQQWGAGRQGLLPLEATMMVAIPELDGATVPTVFGGRSDGGDAPCTGCAKSCVFPAAGPARAMQACPERAAALAAKVAGLAALRRSARAERRLAVVLFNFPPNAGATGTAAHLAVWESLHATLVRLAAEGYDLTPPADVDELREAVLAGNADRYGADANVHVRIPADDHVAREPHLRAIEAQWGPAPGRQQSDGRTIHVLGARFGKVFVGIQPAFGYEGDPMRLLFDGRFTPTHAFSAFYRFLREDFAAHAVLHFGTHGALEFMPGKQAGLSGDCWPERLIGALPNYYLYAANNPSEGLLAKRRSGATLVSYLTPALAEAGLHSGLAGLKTLIDRWRNSPDEAERARLVGPIAAAAEALDLPGDDPEGLSARLYELERTLIPHGLHVLGRPMPAGQRAETLAAMIDAGATDRTALAALLDANPEIDALVHALDAGFVAPSPAGDVLRTPEVLPTGRNLHGFDPFRLPSRFAQDEGAAQAERLVERHLASGAAYPQSIAMVLWGTDNLKSEGAQIAQALALMGARPRLDGYGRLVGAALIPLAELGRPRIDVVMTLSGIFRDLLPLQTRMLAEAAWLAAQAEDEPAEMNFIRARSLAHAARHGCDLETAALRVFSNAEGSYGANVNQLIEAGAWQDPDELARLFETHKGYAYGRDGRSARRAELLESALAGIDLAYQNLDSVELGVTDLDQYVDALGGLARSAARARGSADAAPIYILDATRGSPRVRTLAEQVDLETRTRTLNPVWYEGMLRHGFEGVRHIESHVTATMGWSATTGQVAPWVYQRISETFLLDPAMRDRLTALNPRASARVAGRLIEASDRSFWTPDAETLAALHAASDAIEDRIEGVTAAAAE